MSQHSLQGRTPQEVQWFERRSFVQGAAAFVALGGFDAAHAQSRSNIVELVGDALINGLRLRPEQIIQTGDTLETGPNANLVFVIGNSSFLVRQNTRLQVGRGPTLNAVTFLRLLTGAVASVWGKGLPRKIVTPTLTAGIRGTGVYTEVFPGQNNRSYLCNCYGVVDVDNGGQGTVSRAEYHQAYWGESEPKNGRLLTPAKAINHTDEELEFLARLIGQRTAWQLKGKKGVKDGMGYMEEAPSNKHPADQMPLPK